MSTITTRSGKGSPLTNNEVDANFTNLNTDKLESGDLSVVTTEVGTAALAYNSGVFTYTPPDLTDIDLSLYAPLAGAVFTGNVEAPLFEGDLTGAILFKGNAGEALTKGDPVYISGISGNKTVVSKAAANDANKMPCFGIVNDTVSLNADCSVITFGTLQGMDTSSFSEGDELYISDTGTLTATAPTGEASQIQKIGKVTRSHASAGSIKVMGAGRTNATPNLNDGNFFLGNASNQAVSADFTTAVLGEISAGTGISLSATGVIANTAPDQTVALTGGTGISTSGTYPSFTITNDSPDQTVALTGAGATSISGTYPNFTITSTDTTYSAGTGITLAGTEFSLTDTNAKLNLTGGTLTGDLTVRDNFSAATDRIRALNYSGGTDLADQGELMIRSKGKTGWGVGDELGKITFYQTDTSGVYAGYAASIRAVCETGNGSNTSISSAGLHFYTSAYNVLESYAGRIDDAGIWDAEGGFAVSGTRKDLNWDTAYGWGNHASAGYVTTNTTYSAGTGITLSGTTFSLTDTNAKLNLTGGTLSGTLNIVTGDSSESIINLLGGSQGTGKLYVGQSTTHGGGIEYNGDGTPASSGSGADYVTLFRRTGGVDSWTARNLHNSNDWKFRGSIYANDTQRVFADNYHPNADKLTTARTINGVSFDGTSNITVADSTKLPLSGGTLTGALTVSIPDTGSSPAMSATLNIRGYEGRGAGIKIRDSENSASNPNSREWFIGSGYSQSGFSIGYSSTGSQSSYAAQNKLSIDTSGNVTAAGTITASGYNASNWNTAYGWGNHASAGYYPASNPNGYTNDQTAAEILTAIKTVDGSGSGLDADTVDGVHESTFMRRTANSTLNMVNNNITNVNHLTFNDSGAYEGLQWLGGSDWRIFESPDSLTNAAGNLQFTTGGTRRMTLSTGGSAWTSSQGTLWGSSNDGSGSGLDADLLDGQQGSYYYSSANPPPTYSKYLRSDVADTASGEILFDAGFKSDQVALSGAQNFDNLSRSGFYNLYNTSTGSTNSPGFPYGTLLVQGSNKGGSTFVTQTAYERTGTQYKIRGMNDSASTWYPWQTIWTSGTDGSGSGLDADLLDGQQGSYYYSAGNPPPLTADPTLTLTGDVTGSATFTNLGNATLTATVLNDSHYHSQVYIPDTRGAQRAPSYYPDKYVSFDFQNNADTLAGGDSWNVLQTVAPWSVYDASHRQQQLAWTGTGGLKFRYATSESAWAGWQTLWTSGNDGSGSGLDADLLDGQHGSYYAPASHVHSYLPLSGGTLTGALRVEGGSYSSGIDTATVALAVDKGDYIYSDDGNYLRRIIGHTTGNAIEIGQGGTGLITSINLLPGTAGNSAAKVNGNTIWNAANDGAGSGLDADLLDGVQGSSFLRSDATDTASGAITFSASTIYMAGNLAHSGDTNTYMGFHTADQWRVVTGGVERLEVNNTQTTVAGTFQANQIKHGNSVPTTLGFDPGGSPGSLWISMGATDKSFAVSDGYNSRFVVGSTIGGVNGSGTIESRRQHIFKPLLATTGTASATVISRGTVTTTTGYNPQNFHITFQNGGNVTKGSISSSHYATIYSTSSDYRLKEDLQPISNATERLLALNPVNFKWIDGQERSDGFIAHELQEHLPEAVTGEKDATTEVTETVVAEDGTETEVTTTVPDMQGIDQSKLVPLLVKTIQELEARITALENA